MKKILTVLLVLTLSVAGLFAVLPYSATINLNAKVSEATPEFEVSASKLSTFPTDDNTVATGDNLKIDDEKIAKKDATIDVYFKLKQNNLARYNGKLDVTVTGAAFVSGSNTTTKPSVSKEIITGSTAGITAPENTESAESGIYKGTFDYGAAVPKAAGEVLLLKYTWNADENLPAGNYASTIKIDIVAQGV